MQVDAETACACCNTAAQASTILAQSLHGRPHAQLAAASPACQSCHTPQTFPSCYLLPIPKQCNCMGLRGNPLPVGWLRCGSRVACWVGARVLFLELRLRVTTTQLLHVRVDAPVSAPAHCMYTGARMNQGQAGGHSAGFCGAAMPALSTKASACQDALHELCAAPR